MTRGTAEIMNLMLKCLADYPNIKIHFNEINTDGSVNMDVSIEETIRISDTVSADLSGQSKEQ